MDNKRLEQEKIAARSTQPKLQRKDWAEVRAREEELRTISPLFQKFEGSYPQELSPQAWKSLSQNLANQLGSYKAPLFRTVRDKLTASDSALGHWFWIVVALVLLAIMAGVVALTIGAGQLSLDSAWTDAGPVMPVITVVETAGSLPVQVLSQAATVYA